MTYVKFASLALAAACALGNQIPDSRFVWSGNEPKEKYMKLSTLAFIAATVALPAAAFADSSQPMSAPGKDAPAGATMNKGAAAPTAATTTGKGEMDKGTKTGSDPVKKSMDDPKQYGNPDKH